MGEITVLLVFMLKNKQQQQQCIYSMLAFKERVMDISGSQYKEGRVVKQQCTYAGLLGEGGGHFWYPI